MSVETLYGEYSKLSEIDRIRFLDMVEPENKLSDEWKAEVLRHCEAIEKGESQLLDDDEVDRYLIEKHGLQN